MKLILTRVDVSCSAPNVGYTIFIRRIFWANGNLLKQVEFLIYGKSNQSNIFIKIWKKKDYGIKR